MLLFPYSFPSFVFQDFASTTGLNLKKVLFLNEISDSTTIKNDVKNIAFNNIGKHLGSRLSYVNDVKGLLLDQKITLNLIKDKNKFFKKMVVILIFSLLLKLISNIILCQPLISLIITSIKI